MEIHHDEKQADRLAKPKKKCQKSKLMAPAGSCGNGKFNLVQNCVQKLYMMILQPGFCKYFFGMC